MNIKNQMSHIGEVYSDPLTRIAAEDFIKEKNRKLREAIKECRDALVYVAIPLSAPKSPDSFERVDRAKKAIQRIDIILGEII